ncbi:MAG: hypothetical protein JWL83_4670 [Actinomycetia bacterium]|nr:hypothetical protein [Actinomycetes bacterium]
MQWLEQHFEEETQVGALRAVPTFAEYSVEELRLVDALTLELNMPPRRVLAETGSRANQVLFLVGGFALVMRDSHIVGTLGPGACIGGHEVLADRPHETTVTADGPVVVRVATERAFLSLVEGIPRLARQVAPRIAGDTGCDETRRDSQ